MDLVFLKKSTNSGSKGRYNPVPRKNDVYTRYCPIGRDSIKLSLYGYSLWLLSFQIVPFGIYSYSKTNLLASILRIDFPIITILNFCFGLFGLKKKKSEKPRRTWRRNNKNMKSNREWLKKTYRKEGNMGTVCSENPSMHDWKY